MMDYSILAGKKYRDICDVLGIFPLLQDNECDDGDNFIIRPSHYNNEMSVTTNERLQRLLKIHRKVHALQDVQFFKVSPDVIIFQNYDPLITYTLPITLTNSTKVSKGVKIDFEPSSYFALEHSSSILSCKVAPGMSYTVYVKFTPEDCMDYQHKLTVVTDGESFDIKLLAIGYRPLLDIPDVITVPATPVRIQSDRTLIVYNRGKVDAPFRMLATLPFTVEPLQGVLKPSDSMRLTFSCTPHTVGLCSGQLVVCYETGEKIYVDLTCLSENLNITLDRNHIHFQDTFMGLSRQEVLHFHNTSKHVVKFKWTRIMSHEVCKKRRVEIRRNLVGLSEYEKTRGNILYYNDIIDVCDHETICDRVLQDEFDVLAEAWLAPADFVNFSILPAMGEVWPNSSIEFKVIFKPTNNTLFENTAYLAYSGSNTRPPLHTRAQGLGPSFELNIKVLDCQNIFLCASHQFEIVAHNNGLIPGTLQFKQKLWDFGASITFKTGPQYIEPGKIGSFIFEFYSRVQGKFIEEIEMEISESLEVIKMVMKGDVICPLLVFDVAEVNFGVISLGIPVSKRFNLVNNCQVPIEFYCMLENDGDENAITCEEYRNMEIKRMPQFPKEFRITPISGIAGPYSKVPVQVTVISNIAQHLNSQFICNMWGSSKYRSTLPIEYSSNIPRIVCKTPLIQLNGCFINYPYNRSIVLKNQSEFAGIIMFDNFKQAQFHDAVNYSCPITQAFIQPFGEIKIALTLTTSVIGESRTDISLNIFGSKKQNITVAEIICSGIGPTISFQPDILDFEGVNTLTTYSRLFQISNDSAISATVEISGHGKYYRTDIQYLIIEPNQTEDITVMLYIKTAGRIQEKIKVKVTDGDTTYYTIKAVATGTSILCVPTLSPELNLGYMNTCRPFEMIVTMKNEGSVIHKMMWSRAKALKSLNFKDAILQNPQSVFTMTPQIVDLNPGASAEVTISGISLKPCNVDEDYYCHAIVGKDKKSVIISYRILATFVTPMLDKSVDNFHFNMNFSDTLPTNLDDTLRITNNTKLRLPIQLTISGPFTMQLDCDEVEQLDLTLEDGDECELKIVYKPQYTFKRCFRDEGALSFDYFESSVVERVPLIGEVNFPTIDLLPQLVDFDCIPPWVTSFAIVYMKNISPLRVTYSVEWLNPEFDLQFLEERKIDRKRKKNIEAYYDDLLNHGYSRRNDMTDVMTACEQEPYCGYVDGDKVTQCVPKCMCASIYEEKMRCLLRRLMPSSDEAPETILDVVSEEPEKPAPLDVLQSVLDVVPTEGFLEPFECKTLTIGFSPYPNTSISAKLCIHVKEGETEFLTIEGRSATLTYSLDEVVEFGIQIMSEMCEKTVIFKNTGYQDAEFQITTEDTSVSCDPSPYSIKPRSGKLEAQSQVTLSVRCYPAIAGEFTKHATIEFGNLMPIDLTLHGYSVFTQIVFVHVQSQRPPVKYPGIVDDYVAIAQLTLEYLSIVKKNQEIEYFHDNDISPECKKILMDDGWEIVTYNSLYPTSVDIYLAIDRHTTLTMGMRESVYRIRPSTLPRLLLPTFHVNFGLVIINSIVELPLDIAAYNIDVDLKMVGAKHGNNTVCDRGLSFITKKLQIAPFENKIFYMLFKPTRELYPEDGIMNTSIQFAIARGPMNVVNISARVTTPSAETKTTVLDFGEVQCGTCMRKSLIIENTGLVPCKWRAKVTIPLSHRPKSGGKIFSLRDSVGTLQVGERALILVSFQPEEESWFKATLVISVDENLKEMGVRIKGCGVEPMIKITEENIVFEPSLPHSYREQFFTVENIRNMPVEFIFSDFDKRPEYEDRVVNLLMHYYNTDTLLIPPRTPGTPLPEPIIAFYNLIEREAREWFLDTSHISNLRSTDEFSDSVSNADVSFPIATTEKILPNVRDAHEETDFEANKEQIMLSYMKLMKHTKSAKINRATLDPIADVAAEARARDEITDKQGTKKGMMMIFHGASDTNYIQAANAAGLLLGVAVCNIDQLIMRALLLNNCLASIKINEMLNNKFTQIASDTDLLHSPDTDDYDELQNKIDLIQSGKEKKKEQKQKKEKKGTSISTQSSSGKSSKRSGKTRKSKKSRPESVKKELSAVEKPEKKTKAKKQSTISENGQKSKKSKKSSKSMKSKSSKKSHRKSDNRDTLLDIPVELLCDLIQSTFQDNNFGIIIESLYSSFIRKPIVALQALLKSCGNIRHIQLVIINYNMKFYLEYRDMVQARQKREADENVLARIEYLRSADDLDFETMSTDDIAIYKKYILLDRKLKTADRLFKFRHKELFAEAKAKSKKAIKKSSERMLDKSIDKKSSKNSKIDKRSKSKSSKKSTHSNLSKTSKNSKRSKISKTSKNSKKSKVSSGSVKSERKLTAVEQLRKNLYMKHEQMCAEILHTAEYWNRKTKDLSKNYSVMISKRQKQRTSRRASKSSKSARSATVPTLSILSEADSNAVPAPVTEYTPDQLISMSLIGIPIWVFDDAHPEKPIEAIVSNFLAASSELKNALEELRIINDYRDIVETTELFSVLKRPTEGRTVSESKAFMLMNGDSPVHEKLLIDDMKSRDDFDRYSVDSSKTGLRRRRRSSSLSKTSSKSLDDKYKARNSNTRSVTSGKSISTMYSAVRRQNISIDKDLMTRAVLAPGQKVRFRVLFHPSVVGEYKHVFTVETFGWSRKYKAHCCGLVEIPGIYTDLSMIVPKGQLKRNEFVNTHQRIYDFGSILVGEQTTAEDGSNLLSKRTAFHLINSSIMKCSVSVYLNSDSTMDVFQLLESFLRIPPNTCSTLCLTAAPTRVEVFRAQLYICIRNNPQVEVINVMCSGCKASISVEPRTISFDRVLLNSSDTKMLTLRNESPVGLRWHFINIEAALKYYQFAPTSGLITGKDAQEVLFRFEGNSMADVPTVRLKIEVFDENLMLRRPLLVEDVTITAEVINVQIDYDAHINFGDIKGKVMSNLVYTMTNHAKYDMQFVFTPFQEKNLTLKHQRCIEMVEMVPPTGVLRPNKLFTAHVTLLSDISVTLKQLPVLTCTFMEAVYNKVIDTFTLSVSGRCHLSQFEICPANEILFDSQLIESEQIHNITVKNTGKFSFKFTFMTLNEVVKKVKKEKKKSKKGKSKKKAKKSRSNPSKVSKKTKTSSKTSASNKSSEKSKATQNVSKTSKKESKQSKGSKSKSKKSRDTEVEKPLRAKVTKLVAGVFTVTSSTGTVHPGESVVVNVHSKPKEVKAYQETLYFFVTQPKLKDRFGHRITVKTQGQIPNLNLHDIEEVFKEHLIVDTMSDFNCSEETGSRCVYVKSVKTLYFNKVAINTSRIARIKFTNLALIGTDVHCRRVTGSDVFTVEPFKRMVAAYSSCYFSIKFSPENLDVYTAQFEISYSTFSSVQAEIMQMHVSGNGCIPEIKLIKPVSKLDDSSNNLIYAPIMIGDIALKSLAVKNTGIIACQVIVCIHKDYDNEFRIVVNDEELLKSYNDTGNELFHTFTAILDVQCVMEFNVEYKPIKEDVIKCTLQIYVVNNPFDPILFNIIGEGFKEDVKFDGLKIFTVDDTLLPLNRPTLESTQLTHQSKVNYEIDFGCCNLNRLQRKLFKMTNVSMVYTYKFHFDSTKQVMFVPAAGHLRPGATKEIIATILMRKPTLISKDFLPCNVVRIQYVNEEVDSLSWDERQNFVVWMTKARLRSMDREESDHKFSDDNMMVKTVQGKEEPQHEEIASTLRNMRLCYSVMADFFNYECSPQEILFDDTLMFEKRSKLITVRNKSNIPLPVEWIIAMDVSYPKRVSKTECDTPIKEILSSPTITPIRNTKSGRLRPKSLLGTELFVENTNCILRPNTSRSSLFSSNGSGTSRTHDTWCENDYMPFSIQPRTYAIASQESKDFTVTFAPNDVFEYYVHLHCDMENIMPGTKPIDICVKGRSLLPLYYFNIEPPPSDYLIKHIGSSHDCNTRIVEFHAVGVGNKIFRTFSIINPTGEEFAYRWIAEQPQQLSHFKCHLTEGTVTRGKMVEATFSFLPQKAGIVEELYTFFITRYNLRAEFLLVGNAKEPCVYFRESIITLKPTVIGIQIVQYAVIKNSEELELDFKFIGNSLYGEGRKQKLVVEPRHGVLAPKGEQKVKITYDPKMHGEDNFHVKCVIERKSQLLNLTVVANCYQVEGMLIYRHFDGVANEFNSTSPNIIEFQRLIPMHEETLQFCIYNTGRTGFYYNWIFCEKYSGDAVRVKFSEREGYLKSDSEHVSTIRLAPMKFLNRRPIKLHLQVNYGPLFVINIICTTNKFTYKFSFEEYNFGDCLVQKHKSANYKINLTFSNLGPEPLLLEYDYTTMEHLSVLYKTTKIDAKELKIIKLYFHPIQCILYDTILPFTINGKVHSIHIQGRGVPIQLELDDYRNKYIDLGNPMKGTTIQKRIRVTNNGTCSLKVTFNLYERLPYFSRSTKRLSPDFEFEERKTSELSVVKGQTKQKKTKGKKGKRSKSSSRSSRSSKSSKSSKGTKSKSRSKSSKSKSSTKSKKSKTSKHSKGSKGKKKNKRDKAPQDVSKEIEQVETAEQKERRLILEFVRLTPNNFITISAKKSAEFIITFSPTERMPVFTHKIYFEIQDHIDTLCIFKGACIGSEYHLEREYITFANVIKGCSTESQINLYNRGDIGGKFKWQFDKPNPAFSITPLEGYISTSSRCLFTIKFNPQNIQCIIRAKLRCTIEHYEKTLTLSLHASSTDLPNPRAELEFSCPVRSEQIKSIKINNPTHQRWIISPLVSGLYFEVSNRLCIEPLSTISCNIFYKPLTMTKEKLHETSLFLPLPNGNGVLYNLIGTASRPEPIPIEITVPCKKMTIQKLPITNWLREPQLFRVINEVLPKKSAKRTRSKEKATSPSHKKGKPLYKLTGNEYIEVPGSTEREYSWIFFAMNEGVVHFKVKIRNESTGEYIAYDVMVSVTQSECLGEINLACPARESKTHLLKFENVVGTPVTFDFISSSPQLHFAKSVVIAPYSQYALEITYSPMVASISKQYTFEADTKELGIFPYKFNLTATNSNPEKPIIIETPLGSRKTALIGLKNVSDHAGYFTSKFDDPDQFQLSPITTLIPSGESQNFEITFDPNTLGFIKSKLILSSEDCGEYFYPLICTGIMPQPQGPYRFNVGGNCTINFQNPFTESKIFLFQLSSARFEMKSNMEILKPKQAFKVIITAPFSKQNPAKETAKFPVCGKLTVNCRDCLYADLQWSFYLQANCN